MRTALNRQVVGSIPTASTIESSTYIVYTDSRAPQNPTVLKLALPILLAEASVELSPFERLLNLP